MVFTHAVIVSPTKKTTDRYLEHPAPRWAPCSGRVVGGGGEGEVEEEVGPPKKHTAARAGRRNTGRGGGETQPRSIPPGTLTEHKFTQLYSVYQEAGISVFYSVR